MITTDAAVDAELVRCSREVLAAMVEHLHGSVASPELRALMLDYPLRAGKAIRPALVIAACGAFGGRRDDAMPAAVALELLHNAFLVHDDIEDDSQRRRGGATLHRRVGLARAVHAGDALAFSAFAPLLGASRVGDRVNGRVLAELMAMTNATVHGQDRELRWRDDAPVDVSMADYMELVGQKTAAYTTVYPLRIGAIIATHDSVDLADLTEFGYYLGVAFQIRDDILDLDETNSTKEPHSDLREGKRTLLLGHVASTMDAQERAWLRRFLEMPQAERSVEDVRVLAGMMRSRGAIVHAAGVAAAVSALAYETFEKAFAPLSSTPEAWFLRAAIGYMTARAT